MALSLGGTVPGSPFTIVPSFLRDTPNRAPRRSKRNVVHLERPTHEEHSGRMTLVPPHGAANPTLVGFRPFRRMGKLLTVRGLIRSAAMWSEVCEMGRSLGTRLREHHRNSASRARFNGG